MDPSEVQLLLDNQRKNFNDTIARIEKKFIDYIKENECKLGEIIKSLEFTQHQLQETQDKLNNQCKSHHKEQLENSAEASRRTDFLDDQNRRTNLRFCSIHEHPDETQQQTKYKLEHILRDRLGATPVLESAHRIGKKGNKANRDILARFGRTADRDSIFSQRSTMKGKGGLPDVLVFEDFCPGTVAVRRALMPELREAWNSGKQAYLNYRTLVVKGTRKPRPNASSSTAPDPRSTHGINLDGNPSSNPNHTPDASQTPVNQLLLAPPPPTNNDNQHRDGVIGNESAPASSSHEPTPRVESLLEFPIMAQSDNSQESTSSSQPTTSANHVATPPRNLDSSPEKMNLRSNAQRKQ